jgi:hypothetical protein
MPFLSCTHSAKESASGWTAGFAYQQRQEIFFNSSGPTPAVGPRSRKLMFQGSNARLVRKADNLAAICEPIVWTTWDPHNPVGPHGLLRG